MAEIGPPIVPAFPQHGGCQALDWVEPLLGGDWRPTGQVRDSRSRAC
jgi:hypothetical protein